MKKFLITVMLKKVIKKAVQAAIAWVAALGLQKYGVDIQLNEIQLTGTVFLILEGLRNFLKVKFPKVFGWL